MHRAVADQLELFREQAEANLPVHENSLACSDLEDRISFGIFLYDRICHLDERFRFSGIEDAALDAEILNMYRTWGKAANQCLSALAELESKGQCVRYASEFRKRCGDARGVLGTEIAYRPPAVEPRKKESLEELLSRVTEDNVHPEIDFGPPVGKETW